MLLLAYRSSVNGTTSTSQPGLWALSFPASHQINQQVHQFSPHQYLPNPSRSVSGGVGTRPTAQHSLWPVSGCDLVPLKPHRPRCSQRNPHGTHTDLRLPCPGSSPSLHELHSPFGSEQAPRVSGCLAPATSPLAAFLFTGLQTPGQPSSPPSGVSAHLRQVCSLSPRPPGTTICPYNNTPFPLMRRALESCLNHLPSETHIGCGEGGIPSLA